MTGSALFERIFSRSKAALVFDFDDAIWRLDISEGNKKLGFLKNPGKTAEIIALSDLVIAGNDYLADYARHHNSNVVVIPTVVDARKYPVTNYTDSGKVVIGWTGSHTTIKHFELAIPVLKLIKEKHQDKVEFRVLGDDSYYNSELNIRGEKWMADSEIKSLSGFHIGIMPLPDDEWSKGKCGLKGLQYMALGIPPVMSPVGVNKQIITHGVNGFLPSTDEEWFNYLSQLIGDPNLRKSVGIKARQTVQDKYSVEAVQPLLLSALNSLL